VLLSGETKIGKTKKRKKSRFINFIIKKKKNDKFFLVKFLKAVEIQ